MYERQIAECPRDWQVSDHNQLTTTATDERQTPTDRLTDFTTSSRASMSSTKKRKSSCKSEVAPDCNGDAASAARAALPVPSAPRETRPTPAECHAAVAALAALHGLPEQKDSAAASATAEDHAQQSVLDALVRTILSQNTTDHNSRRAFASLKREFPSWRAFLRAPNASCEDAIRSGGLAEIKTARIKVILQRLLDARRTDAGGEPSLEWLRALPTEEAKAELLAFNGVGPKTVACVLMFCMARAEFPVDTHVWHIAKRLGWCAPSASREACYEHLNKRVPDECKFALHVLLVEHGKRCRRCAKGALQKAEQGACPLVNWSATMIGSPARIKQSENSHVAPVPVEADPAPPVRGALACDLNVKCEKKIKLEPSDLLVAQAENNVKHGRGDDEMPSLEHDPTAKVARRKKEHKRM